MYTLRIMILKDGEYWLRNNTSLIKFLSEVKEVAKYPLRDW